MFKRLAFFEGKIRDGCEDEFDRYINTNLVPLWTRLPGATGVELLREVEAEEGSHRYPFVLQVTFPDRAAIEQMLASPIRYESREVTKGLLELFEGRVFHVIYDLHAHKMAG